jgi:hypothetical protein
MIESQPLIAYQPVQFKDKIPGNIESIPLLIFAFMIPFLTYRSFAISKKIKNNKSKNFKAFDKTHSSFLPLSNIKLFESHDKLYNPFESFPDANLFVNIYKGENTDFRRRIFSDANFDIKDFKCGDFDNYKRNIFLTYGFEESLPAKEISQIQKATLTDVLPPETSLGFQHIERINKKDKEYNVISRYIECILPNSHQSHFLRIRNSQKTKIPPGSSIFTGSCLGSIEFANAITTEGRKISLTKRTDSIAEKIVDIQFHGNMSVYEIATIVESSSLISSMINSNPNFEKVIINLPSGNYYLYVLEAFENGFLSSSQVLEYFEKIDTKEKVILNSLQKRITKQSSRDVLLETQSNIDDSVKIKIKKYVADNNPTQLGFVDELKKSLTSQVFKEIIKSQDISTYYDFLNNDYISLYLERTAPTVFVENYIEEFLLSKAKDLAKVLKIDITNIHSAIYIFPRLVANIEFIGDNSFRNSLYLAEGKLKLSTFKEILRFYRNTFDSSVPESDYIQRYFDQIYDRYNAKQNGVKLHKKLLKK